MSVRRPLLAAATAVAAAAVLSGCGGDQPAPDDARTIAPEASSTSTPPTGDQTPPTSSSGVGRPTPTVKVGESDRAVASVCEALIVGYGEFSPFDFEPAADWFARWDRYADPAFIGQQQVSLVDTWSWTWQRKVKAFDVRILSPGQVSGAGDQRTVKVKADRLILGMNETGDKAVTQPLTFTCQMKMRGDRELAKVTDLTQSPAGAPRG